MSSKTLATGTSIPDRDQPPIDLARLKAYATASGDFNPIHTDETVAKKMGLPGVIAHGMLSAGFIADRAERFIREEAAISGWKVTLFQCRFKAMTMLGDVISVGGTVKEATDSVLTLELRARNQREEVTTTGTVRFSRSS